jgi:hypothetical protein
MVENWKLESRGSARGVRGKFLTAKSLKPAKIEADKTFWNERALDWPLPPQMRSKEAIRLLKLILRWLEEITYEPLSWSRLRKEIDRGSRRLYEVTVVARKAAVRESGIPMRSSRRLDRKN